MKIKKTLAAISIFMGLPLHAQVLETYSFSPNVVIPDGNATGISDVQTISSSGLSIESVKVNLDISGEFNGDLYLYLRHDTGFSVLLNRPGRSAENLFGYDDGGFNIKLSDNAAHDVHTYRDVTTPGSGLQLTGEWQSDARAIDPSSVFASDSRSAYLSSFHGLDPSGQWTLFAVDLLNGGISHINSWGLELVVVPEPQSIALATGAVLLSLGAWRRIRRGQ